MAFAASALRLTGAYLVGVGCTFPLAGLAGGLSSGDPAHAALGLLLGAVFGAGAVVVASPLLAVALGMLALFGDHIRAHLVAWCCAAPFAVAAAWLVYEYRITFSRRGLDMVAYLALDGVAGRAFAAFLAAAIAAFLFHRWEPEARR